MWTLQAPAVTNFRVSYDYYYGGSWDTGRSSLIVWAMGAAPSKDTFWTTDNGNQSTTRGACDKTGCPADHSNAGAELHTILAVLAAGPVQFSDAPGETNASLIMRTCDASGALLQPSKPLTAVDSTHDVTPGAAPQGYALTTHTTISGTVVLRFVLTHQLASDFALRVLDLYPAPTPGSRHAAITFRALQACVAAGAGSTGCGTVIVAVPTDVHAVVTTLPQAAAGADPFIPTLTLLAPLCGSGVALFGEVQKFATLSIQRFTAFACTPVGASFSLSGLAGEMISLAWYVQGGSPSPGATRFYFANYTFAGSVGKARVLAACAAGADGTLAC